MIKSLFTHIDLDGFGSQILINKVFTDIDTYNVNYDFDKELVNKTILANSDMIIFTDISINKELATKLNDSGKSLLLLDHHESAYNELNHLGYNWIIIDKSVSGTKLVYNYFIDKVPSLSVYKDFVDLVNDYDLWIHDDFRSIKLQLLWSNDKDYFYNRFMNNPVIDFTQDEELIIDSGINEISKSHAVAIENLVVDYDLEGNKFAFINKIGKSYSLVASMLLTENPDWVYLVIRSSYGNKLSFRSKSYNIRVIAEALGGGGHDNAAGCQYLQMQNIIESVKQRKPVMYSFVK